MAPPLLPLTRLVTCSSCAQHVKSSEDSCPHCGVVLGGRGGLLARAAGVALAGVVLSACNGKDGNTEGGTADTTTSTSSDSDTDPTGFESQAAYGVPATEASGTTVDPATTTGATESGTVSTGDPDSTGDTANTEATGTTVDTSGDTDTGDTGNSSMTGGPEYGVPDTTGPEPDYGVPGTTGPEPDYGVPGTT